MYLLDTSVWIPYLRGGRLIKKESFHHYIINPLQSLNVATCGIILYELFQGAKNETHIADIEKIRKAAFSFELIEEDYVFGARLSQNLLKKNQFLPMPDVMIAVCALKNDLTLVSADRHFERIKRLEKNFKYERFDK